MLNPAESAESGLHQDICLKKNQEPEGEGMKSSSGVWDVIGQFQDTLIKLAERRVT